jgi:hypothetical protein
MDVPLQNQYKKFVKTLQQYEKLLEKTTTKYLNKRFKVIR